MDSLYARICLRTSNLLDSYYLKIILSEPSLDIRTSSFVYNYYLRKSSSKTFRAMMNIVVALPPSCAKEFRGHSKIVKTYLRSTTGEGRLNHVMLLHGHKELADGIDMVEVANLFVGDNQRRKQLFGKFSKNDLPAKSTFASKATQTV